MPKINFTKMHGCGNDFILIDDRDGGIPDDKKGEIAVALCRRHFSVGADGVLYICNSSSEEYDVRMRIFNPDGSEAEMCGNGMRCFAKYVYKQGIVRKKQIKVETLAGKIVPEVEADGNGIVISTRVFMGMPIFERIDEPFFVNAEVGKINMTTLSLGNPHAVVILDSFTGFNVDTVGKAIESHEAFPNRTNVDFIKLLQVFPSCGDKLHNYGVKEIQVRTYERGVGETLSCGTGSTASVLTLNKLGDVHLNEPVIVHTLGGDLVVEVKEEGAYLQGPAEEVFEGVVEVKME